MPHGTESAHYKEYCQVLRQLSMKGSLPAGAATSTRGSKPINIFKQGNKRPNKVSISNRCFGNVYTLKELINVDGTVSYFLCEA